MVIYRPRRNRKNSVIRTLVQETSLSPSQLIYPLFVKEGESVKEPIATMPEVSRFGLDALLREIERARSLGIRAIALFPCISKELKSVCGKEALNPRGLAVRAIQKIKEEFPDICVISDIALDPYTSHGHDGLVDEKGDVLNDATVEILAKMALVYAEAGSDMVAPSDMMDGRIGAIREALEHAGYTDVNILAYSAKYASSFYAPFRDALQSRLSKGDKRSYQLNPANIREALLEAALDEKEGADILMVKPALPYLDVIAKIRASTKLPIAAYQVSGEYSMIMAAGQSGFCDVDQVFLETLLSIKRAGADMIFTYAAIRIAPLLSA